MYLCKQKRSITPAKMWLLGAVGVASLAVRPRAVVHVSETRPRAILRISEAGLNEPGPLQNYYRTQLGLSDAELDELVAALGRPLPLVVRAPVRAPLAERALAMLSEAQVGEGELDQRELSWACTPSARTYQWARCAAAARGFVHRQQLRSALQRQEAASMLPALVLAPRGHHAVLDMCAAPGSKSLQIAELMEADAGEQAGGHLDGERVDETAGGASDDECLDGKLSVERALAIGLASTALAEAQGCLTQVGEPASKLDDTPDDELEDEADDEPDDKADDETGSARRAISGLLVANDASLARAISLTHRLTSVNAASPLTVVTSLDARWWPPLGALAFDRVLCDVPCSGDGTLRKR